MSDGGVLAEVEKLNAMRAVRPTTSTVAGILEAEGRTDSPWVVTEGIQHSAWRFIDGLRLAMPETGGSGSDDQSANESNQSGSWWDSPFADAVEALFVAQLAELLQGLAGSQGLECLAEFAVAVALAQLAVSAVKTAVLISQGRMTASEGAAYLEQDIATVLARIIEVGGLALGTALGSAFGSPIVGGLIGREIAKQLGPRISSQIAQGLISLAPLIVAKLEQLSDTARAWLRSIATRPVTT